MFLTTQLMADLQRAGQFMLRHSDVSIGFTDGGLRLYEAHQGGRLIGASPSLSMLLDLLEKAERLH